MDIGGKIMSSNNNNNLPYRKGSIDKGLRSNYEEMTTGTFSRKSVLRHTLRQPSISNPNSTSNKRTLTFLEGAGREFSLGHSKTQVIGMNG